MKSRHQMRTMKTRIFRRSIWVVIGMASIATGCYYDNYEDLYQHLPSDNCDTPLSSFSADIQPWISSQCESCHNSSLAQGGLDLTTYSNVKDNAASILDRISRLEGDPLLMPQGGTPMSQCTIDGFSAWIDLGSPEN